MSIFTRTPKAPKPANLALAEELRNAADVLTGWTVRGTSTRAIDSLLYEAAREIERLASSAGVSESGAET